MNSNIASDPIPEGLLRLNGSSLPSAINVPVGNIKIDWTPEIRDKVTIDFSAIVHDSAQAQAQEIKMKEQEAQVKELADKGFLIYTTDSVYWTIHKIPTAADARTALSDGNPMMKGYLTKEDAIEVALNECEENLPKVEYAVEVCYNDGLGPKFMVLDYVEALTHEEAQNQAVEKCERYFSGKKTKWETRVRPKTISDL